MILLRKKIIGLFNYLYYVSLFGTSVYIAMAATRKLQGEIDRCLKKVTEGVETFEDIWQKVHNATNSNQKVCEKYEADLKKEIKKLQRLRDQIKSWIQSAEIKDKSALLENRRLIETQMERFKVVERETKTKAYSKEGLGAAQKLDPAQKEKDEISNWLTSSISLLQIQIDQYESEIESLLAGKKKRLDKDKQDRMDELRSKLDRNKFHIAKLETLLRMLDNDTVDVEQVRRIKDDVEYYIESSQEPDFEENEYIYDDIIGLDEVELSGTEIPSPATDSNNSNDTGGSPSSITSGTSPVQSPLLNCSSSNAINNSTINNHSESTSTDYTDKRNSYNKNETSSTKVTPVKPTAVRASKIDLNLSSTSNNSSTNMQPPIAKPIGSSTPSKNNNNTSITSLTSIQLPAISSQSVISSAAPIAFAAIAKHNTSHVENGPLHPIASFSMASSTSSLQSSTSSASSIHLPTPISVSQNSVQQQLQTTISSSTNNNTNVNLTIVHQVQSAIGLIHNNNITSSSSASETIVNASNTSNSISSNVTNGVSPSNSVVSSRTSPGIMSPPQQQIQQQQQQIQQQQQLLNGPSLILKNPIPLTSNSPSADSMSSLKTMAQEAINRAGLENTTDGGDVISSIPSSETTVRQQLFMDSAAVTNGPNLTNLNNVLIMKSTGTSEAHIPPLLGVAPLGPSPLQKEHQLQFQMMEAAYYHLPAPNDSERLRIYMHRHPVQTPHYYPQSHLPHSDTVDFFQRLSTETLFFVFYYMEGTKAQYLAAKALKKQSWRFHTKYMMWFQRHEEPKIINEEYEQGTYIYFDYEKWGQRKKEGFTFEYKYLEDRDLN